MNEMETKKEYFEFLDDLKLSGVTNMAVATPYLQAKFYLDRNQARGILFEWIYTYEDRLEKGEIKEDGNLIVTENTIIGFEYKED